MPAAAVRPPIYIQLGLVSVASTQMSLVQQGAPLYLYPSAPQRCRFHLFKLVAPMIPLRSFSNCVYVCVFNSLCLLVRACLRALTAVGASARRASGIRGGGLREGEDQEEEDAVATAEPQLPLDRCAYVCV